jgi:pilus assembly protein Flp/PilA
MINKMKNLFVEEQGQGMTEYGLILGAIAIGVVAALVLLRGQISTLITNVKNGIAGSATELNSTPTTTP